MATLIEAVITVIVILSPKTVDITCGFDNQPISGHYVTSSKIVSGACHDEGPDTPYGISIIGKVR